jgi:hypothetical protein
MRHSAARLLLFASATLALVATATTRTVAQTGCEQKRQACVAECRAQYFATDPKRDACIASCVSAANRCVREQAQAGDPAAGRLDEASCRMIQLPGPLSLDERSPAARS